MIWNQTSWNQSYWGPVSTNQTTTHMAEQDLTNIQLDEAWITELNTRAEALITHLLTKAVSLADEQRKRHRGIGPESLSMVEDGVALIRDHPTWFTPAVNRDKLLNDVEVRDLWLQGKSKIMQINELFFDTLQALCSDIVRRVRAGRPFIESGAALTGQGNDQVREYLEWFKRFGAETQDEEPPTPPTPPTP